MTALVQGDVAGMYRPDSGENFVFLLLSGPSAEPPDTLRLEDTWDQHQPARWIGFHVFLDAFPSGRQAAVLADELRRALPASPVTTGFAWAGSAPNQFSLAGTVSMTIAGDRPSVAGDALVQIRPPMPLLTIPHGLAAQAHPGLAGWTLCDPRAQPAPALDVPLLGPDSGVIGFHALLASAVGDNETIKPLAGVRIDPLRPFDPTRTSITPLANRYRLSVGSSGTYQLTPEHP